MGGKQWEQWLVQTAFAEIPNSATDKTKAKWECTFCKHLPVPYQQSFQTGRFQAHLALHCMVFYEMAMTDDSVWDVYKYAINQLAPSFRREGTSPPIYAARMDAIRIRLQREDDECHGRGRVLSRELGEHSNVSSVHEAPSPSASFVHAFAIPQSLASAVGPSRNISSASSAQDTGAPFMLRT
eukprot:771137-Rhodomonas_salina.1